jgi:diguanylate cyclase (GGDEF)-like protein
MCAAAGVLTLALTLVAPPDAGPARIAVTFVVPGIQVVLAGLLTTLRGRHRDLMCVIAAAIGAVSIAALDLATHDASAGAQIFLCYPVLYAAWWLRPAGAWLVGAVSVVGEAAVTLHFEPSGRAVTDLAYVGVTLLTMTGLLTRAGQRHDQLVAQLSRQARIDSLTGLATRRVLDDATRAALHGGSGELGTALILVDVDRFKAVNDTYGHPVGDDALVHVARIITPRARPDAVIARVGGDEFAILLAACPARAARRRADEVIRAIATEPVRLAGGAPLPISVSVGVAHVTDPACTTRDLYALADTALYRAKRGGRGRVAEPADPLPGRPARDPRVADRRAWASPNAPISPGLAVLFRNNPATHDNRT